MGKSEEKKAYRVRRIRQEGEFEAHAGTIPLPRELWQEADLLEDFTFPWTDEEAPLTSFRAVWNEEFFCFRYEVVDHDVVTANGKDAMEKVVGSDRVEIFFTTGPDLNPYYGLEIDPRGEVLAYQGKYHRIMNWDWECPGLLVWGNITDMGYEVEAAIPVETLKSLNCLHAGQDGNFFQAGLFRAEFSHGEAEDKVIEDWISWVDPGGETPDFHVPAAFGVLRLEG